MATTTLDYLIPVIRMKLGDDDIATQRYADEWLVASMLVSVKRLERWWGSKYIADSAFLTVERNDDYTNFTFDEPPVIQRYDEYIIVLMASIIVKTGNFENMSWDLSRWKDAEISVSNIASGDAKKFGIVEDLKELHEILKPPLKRTFHAIRSSFPEE